MSTGYNKEWETGDIIEATDLNGITPLMFGAVYNETEDVVETTLTVQEIFDGLLTHHIGIIVNANVDYMVYDLIIIVAFSFEERANKYYMKGYGSDLGTITQINFEASSLSSKFHLVTNTQNSGT